MEFNTLKEERRAHPGQDAAPSPLLSETTAPGSSRSGSRSSPLDTQRGDFPPQTDPETAPVPPTRPVPTAEGGVGRADAASFVTEAEAEQPLRAHNLVRATQLLQSGVSPSPFTPAPILRLNSIRINALSNTTWNAALYGSRIEHPLPFQPTTLPSIFGLTGSIVSDLNKFDVFNSIDATLAPSFAPGASEEDVDVILTCKPKGRVFLKSSTDVGNGEGSASVQGRIRNVFGGAETLQGSATFGTRTRQAFNLQFASPLLANPDHTASLSAFASERDLTAFSSAFESIKGFRAALSSNAGPAQHELAYEASVRSLGRLLPDASISMRKLATQPTVKSSFSHTFLRDTRNDPALPGTGSYFKAVQELAGFGGDASFYKVETELSLGRRWSLPTALLNGTGVSPSSRADIESTTPTSPFEKEDPLPADLPTASSSVVSTLPISTFTLRTGFLRTLSASPSLYSDRFQLGGPTCVRMFQLNGLGPKDKMDSLGGDAYWSLGLGTNFDIPKKPHWPVKLHAFANAGQLVQLNMAKPLQDLPTSLSPLLQPSVSAGLGLVYLQGPLRVELNAGLPIAARKSDSMRKGLQLGVGISFL